MIVVARVRPPGSFLVVAGDADAPMPEFDDQPMRLWSNEWCVGVGTMSETDGETQLTVSDHIQEGAMPVVYDGVIACPDKIVTVSDAYLATSATVNLNTNYARIIVRANDAREPDEISVSITPIAVEALSD